METSTRILIVLVIIGILTALWVLFGYGYISVVIPVSLSIACVIVYFGILTTDSWKK